MVAYFSSGGPERLTYFQKQSVVYHLPIYDTNCTLFLYVVTIVTIYHFDIIILTTMAMVTLVSRQQHTEKAYKICSLCRHHHLTMLYMLYKVFCCGFCYDLDFKLLLTNSYYYSYIQSYYSLLRVITHRVYTHHTELVLNIQS